MLLLECRSHCGLTGVGLQNLWGRSNQGKVGLPEEICRCITWVMCDSGSTLCAMEAGLCNAHMRLLLWLRSRAPCRVSWRSARGIMRYACTRCPT